MAKSSFADAERQGKTLSEILNEDAKESVLETSEPQVEAPEETQESTPEVEPQGKEPRPVSPLVKRLRESGFDISDDVEEEDLYGSLVDRIRSQDEIRRQIEQERQEREKLAKDLEEARKQLEFRQAEPPKEVPQEKPKENPWGPLEEVDRESLRFIEQDPETGLYRSRPEYKDVGGKEVADRANKYALEIKKRSQTLLRDPVSAVWDGMSDRVSQLIQDRASQIVEERLKAYDSTAKSGLAAAFEKKQQSVIKAERIDGFWSERAPDLLKIDSAGNVMFDLDGNPIKTDVGKVFYDELRYIREDLGVKDEEKALSTAWRNVSRIAPPRPTAPAQVSQEVEPEAPVQEKPTREEKKKKFVERRIKTDPSVPADDAVYREPVKETPRFTGRISLADLVKESDE